MPAYRLSSAILSLVMALAWHQRAVGQNCRVVPDRCRNVELTQQNGVLEIRTTGKDPFLVADLVGVKPNDLVLEMDCFATEGVKNVELFLGPPFSQQSRTELPPIPVSQTWESYATILDAEFIRGLPKKPTQMRLDLGKRPDVRLQIRRLRFRPISAAERKEVQQLERVAKAREKRASLIVQYSRKRFADRIETVAVSKQQIVLKGKRPSEDVDVSDVRIVECPPWKDITNTSPKSPGLRSIKPSGNTWTATVPRFDGDRDRLHSSWRIAVDDRWLSSRRFPTSIETVGSNHAAKRMVPGNQKGLGGISRSGPLEELPELGVTAITVNVVLSSFVSERPGPGRELIANPSPADNGSGDQAPLYFNPAAFKNYDAVINFARQHDIVVSAILLVPTRQRDAKSSILIHPDNDGGKYTMPNLTDAYATEVYAFVLNRLARRYRNPTKAPGGITNWIAHNEIDYHKQWTNMGTQPRALVTETYYRSMRMIDAAARSYNPHARVFVSLTHSWMVPDDGKGDRLAPREVVVALQQYSALEGDFPWGLAYHPYPQSLFSETAWNDKIVTEAFDTPMITMQNIEVLEKFMAHRLMLDSSKQPRPILLSEQGFHTQSYDESSQANQAGSLAYAMSKISALKTIESFHYHRWIDNPNEGGLKMGLRTLPTKEHPDGEKKQAWHVYQAIGTPQQESATKGLPGPRE